MNKEGIYQPVNIGNANEFTILDCAKIILEKTKSKSIIINEPLPLDDPIRRKPDISFAKKNLNWVPLIDLNEGLEKTINYFKNNL